MSQGGIIQQSLFQSPERFTALWRPVSRSEFPGHRWPPFSLTVSWLLRSRGQGKEGLADAGVALEELLVKPDHAKE